MKLGVFSGRHVAWLMVAASASCAHKQSAAERPRAATVSPAAQQPSAAEQSRSALQATAQSQRELAEQQKRLEEAHRDVVAAEQQLAQARAREDQERAKTQELQRRVTQEAQQAAERAREAQAAVEQAQGLQSKDGQVVEATRSHVILQTPDGKTYAFAIDRRTQVLVGTEQRSVADIQQGADARVSYDPRAAQPTAVMIRLTPVGNRPAPGANPP